MSLRVYYIILIFVFFNHCKDKDKNVLVEVFPDGIKSAEIPYLIKNGDTVINGTVKYFYHNGKIQDEFESINGKKNGWHIQYDSVGRVTTKVMYKNNKVTGHSFRYFISGKVEIEELRNNDSLIMLKNFFPNGKLYSMSIYISKKDVKYYVIFDSLGKKLEEQGEFDSKDTLLDFDVEASKQ